MPKQEAPLHQLKQYLPEGCFEEVLEIALVIENAGLRRMESRQERCSGWIAQRILAICAIKSSRNRRQFVYVR